MRGFTLGGGGSSWTREEKDASQAIYRTTGGSLVGKTSERCRFPWQQLQ